MAIMSMCFEGRKISLGFRPLLEASGAHISSGASYPSARVARMEKVLAQPSLFKVKPFSEPIANTASTLDHSWGYLLSETKHACPGWMAGWCLAA